MRKLIIGLIIGLLLLIAVLFIEKHFNQKEVHNVQEIQIRDLENLVIKSTTFDVEIIPTSQVKLQAKLTGNASSSIADDIELIIEQQGNQLMIEPVLNKSAKGFFSTVYQNNVKLTVAVPNKDWAVLKVTSKSSNVKIESINTNLLQSSGTSGDHTLLNIVAKEIELETASGNQRISNVSADRLTSESSSGDVSMELLAVDELNGASKSGNQSYKQLQSEITQFTSTSGDVSLKGLEGQKLSLSTTSGNIKTHLVDALLEMNVTSNSGDVTVHFTKKMKDMKLVHSTNSGDFSVDIDGMNDKFVIGAGRNVLTMKTTSGNIVVNEQ